MRVLSAWVAAVDAPWFEKALIFKFHAGLRVIANLVALFVISLAHEFNGAASTWLVTVNAEDFSDEPEPPSAYQNRERFIFVSFIDMMPIEVSSGHVAFAAFHATDAFLEFV